MSWYIAALKKYAVFSGRARRKEYWIFGLFHLIIVSVLAFVGAAIFLPIYPLAVLIPSLAVTVRRLHDTNHSGWWALIPIANIVLMFIDGTRGDNRFGPDPKAKQQ